MRNIALITSIVLALMSGFVLSQLWSMEPVSTSSIPAASNPQIEETVQTFYSAVNSYLDDTDEDGMRNFLHREFVTHQLGSAWTGTVDDYLDHLNTVRRLYPGIQVKAKVASLGNNTASVTLSVKANQLAEFAGIGIDPADVIGRLDLVRVESGLIVERWSSAPLAGQLNAFSELSIDLPDSVNGLVARVQEVPLDADSTMEVNHLRHMVMIVTAGEARLDLMERPGESPITWRMNHHNGAEAEPIETETTVSLQPMDAIYLPGGTKFRIWQSDETENTLIVLEFGNAMPSELPATSPLGESLAGTLWSGIELDKVGDRLTLSFGQAMLLPQSLLSVQRIDGLELAFVASGSVDITGFGGETRVRKAGGNRLQVTDGGEELVANETAASGPGSTMRYQVNGDTPASVWLFSIVPDHPSIDPGDKHPADEPTPNPVPAINPSLK